MIDFRHITAAEYHKDPFEDGSLSSSIAHTIVSRSPLHAYAEHPRLGGKDRVGKRDDDTEAMHTGRIFHDMILGVGSAVTFVAAKDWRTNAAKAQRDEIEAAGGLAVLEKHEAYYRAAVGAIATRINELGYTLSGESELMVAWEEGDVQCRGLIDHLLPDGTIIDLKMCADARAATMARKFIDYGYDIQGTAYKRGVEMVRPELRDRARVVFLFAETAYPFDVVPVTFAGSMADYGLTRWTRGVSTWRKCRAEGRWPGCPAQRVECPEWAMVEEGEAER